MIPEAGGAWSTYVMTRYYLLGRRRRASRPPNPHPAAAAAAATTTTTTTTTTRARAHVEHTNMLVRDARAHTCVHGCARMRECARACAHARAHTQTFAQERCVCTDAYMPQVDNIERLGKAGVVGAVVAVGGFTQLGQV